MKNQLILIILGLLISTGCYVQNKYPEGVSKVRGEQFKIEYTGLENDRIVVYNLKGKLAQGEPISDKPYALRLKREDIHFDITAAKTIIREILKPKAKELRQSEDFPLVILHFERTGKLTDISYGFKKGTLVSLKDIAKIDARLRRTIRATYTGITYKDYKLLMYSLGIIQF